MKSKIILIILISCFCMTQSFSQINSSTKSNNKETVFNKKTNTFLNAELRKPKTKKLALLGVKVLNRHQAKFYYNNTEISFRTAKKLVKQNFNNMSILENWKTAVITFTTVRTKD